MVITEQDAKLKHGYKQTEVGVIPEEWNVKPLKQLSPRQCVGVVVNPSSYFDDEGTVPFLVGSNVGENSIKWRTAKRISDASNQILGATRLAAGDLVTVRVGEPGVTAVIPPELNACNCASMMIVRQHPSFDSHWLCWVMNSRIGRLQVDHVQYGTAQKQFNISDAVDFCFPVPPLTEQHAMATALSDVDALIALLDKQIAKKRDIKQATMQQLITGKTRLLKFSEEWKTMKLEDIAEVGRGRVISHREIYASIEGKYPVYSSQTSSNGIMGYIDTFDFDGEYVTWTTDGVNAGTVFYRNGKFNCTNVCGTIKLKRDNPQFVAMLLNEITPNYVSRNLANPKLMNDSMKKIKIPLPSFDEQTSIATVISDIDAEIAALEQRRDKTRALKQGMMQELLTGKTRLI